MLLPQTMLEIVEARGGLIIDLKKQAILPQTLLVLAKAAAVSGANITIKNPNFLLPQHLKTIALVGRGRVTFEL